MSTNTGLAVPAAMPKRVTIAASSPSRSGVVATLTSSGIGEKSIRDSGSHAALSGPASIVAEPRHHHLAGGRELGRQRVRHRAGTAEEQVEQFENKAAVEDYQCRAVRGRHRQRQPGGQPIRALGAIIGKALDGERLGPAAHFLAEQRFPHCAQPAREPRRQVLQRVEIAERVELALAEHAVIGSVGTGPLAPIASGLGAGLGRRCCRGINHGLTERRNW